MGCGTGSNPTRVPCCKNFKISDSSVRPLKQIQKENSYKCVSLANQMPGKQPLTCLYKFFPLVERALAVIA